MTKQENNKIKLYWMFSQAYGIRLKKKVKKEKNVTGKDKNTQKERNFDVFVQSVFFFFLIIFKSSAFSIFLCIYSHIHIYTAPHKYTNNFLAHSNTRIKCKHWQHNRNEKQEKKNIQKICFNILNHFAANRKRDRHNQSHISIHSVNCF